MGPDGCSRLDLAPGRWIAYRAVPGREPTVVFLGGFASDMTGTKARFLERLCRETGQGYVRFDYTGHGASSGRFADGTMGRWTGDAVAVVDRLVPGPVVLVGSSMGGWIAARVVRERPDRVVGLVTVAAAPDFTEAVVRPRLGPADRATLARRGWLGVPNPYGDEPTVLTRELMEDGRRCVVLDGAGVPLVGPARLLHGLADRDVPWQLSVRLAEAVTSSDVEVVLIKDGDHRLSDERGLARLRTAVLEVVSIAGPRPGKDGG